MRSQRPSLPLQRAKSDSELVVIRRKRVQFGSLVVDEFATILGDTVPQHGPPIALEHKAIRSFSMDLDTYEATRPEGRRTLHDLQLDSWERTRILFGQGNSLESIALATSSAEEARSNREKSLKDKTKSSKLRRFVSFTKQLARRFSSARQIAQVRPL